MLSKVNLRSLLNIMAQPKIEIGHESYIDKEGLIGKDIKTEVDFKCTHSLARRISG